MQSPPVLPKNRTFVKMRRSHPGRGEFRKCFKPQPGFEAEYAINIEEKSRSLVISISGTKMECKYGSALRPDVEMDLTRAILEDITRGRMTFQRAFMSGAMRMKGDFKVLRTLDAVFVFNN